VDLRDREGGTWTLTGHGRVLVETACNSRARVRDIGATAGLAERTVQAIIADLEAAGYLSRSLAGRRASATGGASR
jgi:DNA-binding MarR family transcriptional regulator